MVTHFIHNKNDLWGLGRSAVLSGIGNRDEGSKKEVIDNKAGCFTPADKTQYSCKYTGLFVLFMS